MCVKFVQYFSWAASEFLAMILLVMYKMHYYLSGMYFRPVFVCEYFTAAGSLLGSMATAVENTRVFLMCFSLEYKNSLNCRTGYFLPFIQKLFNMYSR